MQIFTYQTGIVSLALRVGEEERAVLLRVPREMASLGAGQVSVWKADGGMISEKLQKGDFV